MASFCTKCGAALSEGSQFCTSCGTAAAGAEAPAAPAARPAAAAAQSTSAVKVVLIVVAVFIGLGILGTAAVLFGVWRLSRSVDVDPSGKVRITTPMGNMTMGTGSEVSEAELGVPVYPGAKREEGGFQITTAEGAMGGYAFKTSDAPEQVVEFYRSQLGAESAVVQTPAGAVITSPKSEKEGLMITIGRDEEDGKTLISILRGRSDKAP